MRIESKNINPKFLKELERKLETISVNLEQKLNKGDLNFDSKIRIKRKIKIFQEMIEISRKLRFYDLSYKYRVLSSNSSSYLYNTIIEHIKDDKKEFKRLKKDVSKILAKLQKMNGSLKRSSAGSSYEIDMFHNLKMNSFGNGIEFKPLFEAFAVLIDDVLELSKNKRYHQSQNTSNKNNSTTTSNISSEKISKTSYSSNRSVDKKISTTSYNSYQSEELLHLVMQMRNIAFEKKRELFSPYQPGNEKEEKFDNNKFIEYKKQYKEFEKLFKKLSLEEKKQQIRRLNYKDEILQKTVEMIFETDYMNIDNFNIKCLSPDSLLKLVNKVVKTEMFEKECYYYGRTRDVIADKPLDRDYEICNVTRYMEIEEIVQIYKDMKSTMVPAEFNKFDFRDLQRNFAMAIYMTLINRGYIKENDKTKDSIIHEICTKILKEGTCLFKECANTENIDLVSIINSKKYDIAKEFFEKESSFGNLKRNINNIQKENKNARKL